MTPDQTRCEEVVAGLILSGRRTRLPVAGKVFGRLIGLGGGQDKVRLDYLVEVGKSWLPMFLLSTLRCTCPTIITARYLEALASRYLPYLPMYLPSQRQHTLSGKPRRAVSSGLLPKRFSAIQISHLPRFTACFLSALCVFCLPACSGIACARSRPCTAMYPVGFEGWTHCDMPDSSCPGIFPPLLSRHAGDRSLGLLGKC